MRPPPRPRCFTVASVLRQLHSHDIAKRHERCLQQLLRDRVVQAACADLTAFAAERACPS